MFPINKMQGMTGVVTGLFLLFVTVSSQGEEIRFMQEEHGLAQEQMGREIRSAAWLEWNKGLVQENLGVLIQKQGSGLHVEQEALASGIVSSAQITLASMNTQEDLGKAILEIAKIVQADARNFVGNIQRKFEKAVLPETQAAVSRPQSELERQQLRQRVQLEAAGKFMASALESTLRGEITSPISKNVINSVLENRGYNQLSNFVLAVTLLEKERGGTSLSHLISNIKNTPAVGSSRVVDKGWGGFAEYGFAAIAGFLFMIWGAGISLQNNRPPMAETDEETSIEYPKAA